MRLDHLLSKEKSEGETRKAHPRSIGTEGEPEVLKGKCEEHRLSFENLLAVSFSGSSLKALKK